MFLDSMSPSSPYLEASIKELLLEDSMFDQNERRSLHREVLVRPVVLELRDSDQIIEGFSRNISFRGVSLLTRRAVAPDTVAKILIHRLHHAPTQFLVECRWVGPFGVQWNVSGWNFLNVDLSR
jgi:PilZ domain